MLRRPNVGPDSMRLLLRLFVDCVDDDHILRTEATAASALSAFEPGRDAAPERYWKMPDLVELTFALHPAKRATLDAVVALSTGGWDHSGDASEASSVWNRVPGRVFLVPEAAWAELILTR